MCMFESENRKMSNQNRKIEFGITEAEIRIEAAKLTTKMVTALLYTTKLTCRQIPAMNTLASLQAKCLSK